MKLTRRRFLTVATGGLVLAAYPTTHVRKGRGPHGGPDNAGAAAAEADIAAAEGSAASAAAMESRGFGQPEADLATTATPGRPTIFNTDGALQLQANSERLVLAGAVVMGVPASSLLLANFATGGGQFAGEGQYPNRELICATLKAWGGNAIRLRFSSTDIATGNYGWDQAAFLQCITDWVTTAKANGMYVVLCDWSAFENPPAGQSLGNWPSWISSAFPVWLAIAKALGNDPYVIWEPLNEPANTSWGNWLTAFQSIAQFFRETAGYFGVLICDGLYGSSAWDQRSFDALTVTDVGLVRGTAQIAFTNHDYALTSNSSTFSGSAWLRQTLGGSKRTATQFCRFETEFGNSVPGGGGNAQWTNEAATFFTTLPTANSSFAGAFAWVWGPWTDANAITQGDNKTPTGWGYTVQKFLRGSGATAVPVVD